MIKAFSFYLSGNVFISSSFLKESFISNSILNWKIIFFLLEFYIYLSTLMFTEKSAMVMEVPMYITSCFSFFFQNSLLSWNFWKFCIMCLSVDFCGYILFEVIYGTGCPFAPQIWEVFSHYFSVYIFWSFPFFFWHSQNVYEDDGI